MVSVLVSNNTFNRLQQRTRSNGQSVDTVADQVLDQALRHLPEAGRAVILGGDTLDRLEAILGGGSVMSGADLLQKVERLAGISFQHVRLPFTPNQLEQLKEKAERNSMTVKQLVERTAPRMYAQFFNLMERS